jgi:hypothetical protein
MRSAYAPAERRAYDYGGDARAQVLQWAKQWGVFPNYPNAPGPIRPIAQAGDYVLLADRESYHLYQVAFYEGIPESTQFRLNIGAIGAGVTAPAFSTQAALDMANGQLSQLRWYVLDDIEVELAEPAGVYRFSSLNTNAAVDLFTHVRDPFDAATEVYVFEAQRPSLRATNPTGVALAQARVQFYGFRFVLYGRGGADSGGKAEPFQSFGNIHDAVEQIAAPFIVIPTSAWGR